MSSPAVGDDDGVARPGVSLSKTPAAAADADEHARGGGGDGVPIWAMGTNGQPMNSADTPPFPLWPDPPTPERPRLSWRGVLAEALWALAVAAIIAGLGVPLGWLWATFSPHVTLEMTPSGPSFTRPNPEEYIGAESVYLLICLAMGLITAVAVWVIGRRRRGPILLVGLAAGSVAGALLMAWLGHRIGLAEYERLLDSAPVGSRFDVPVDVRSMRIYRPEVLGVTLGVPLVRGSGLVQAMIAVALYTAMAGFHATANLRPGQRSSPAEPAPFPFSSDFPEQRDHRVAPAPPGAG